MKKVFAWILVLAVGFGVLPVTGWGDRFRWVDEDGVTHFTDTPKHKGYRVFIREKRSRRPPPLSATALTRKVYEQVRRRYYDEQHSSLAGFAPSGRGDGTYVQLYRKDYKPFPDYKTWKAKKIADHNRRVKTDALAKKRALAIEARMLKDLPDAPSPAEPAAYTPSR